VSSAVVSEEGRMSGPEHALLVRDFVNTYDMQCDIEEFGAPSDLSGWLAERGLVASGASANESDLGLAVALREGLRTAMIDRPRPELEGLLAALPVRVSLDGPRLVPLHRGVRGGLARVAAAVMASAADGTWERLKACRATGCRWAFLDTSKNRSRAWCSMRMCGNRTKTRAYRERRRRDAVP
jgi:predicted RNA-binding Zn ribbon-like protein